MNIDELVPNMILEWQKGDKQGEKEIIKDVEKMGEFAWINFHSGGRINGHAIDEFMLLVGVASPEEVARLNKKEEPKDDLYQVAVPKIYGSVGHTVEFENPFQQVDTSNYDFHFNVLDKAKHDSKLSFNINVEMDFVSKEKLEVLLDVYGEELFEALKLYIGKKIDADLINKSIEDVLKVDFPKIQFETKIEEIKSEDKSLDNIYNTNHR